MLGSDVPVTHPHPDGQPGTADLWAMNGFQGRFHGDRMNRAFSANRATDATVSTFRRQP